jgi:hypothetical protein
MLIYVTMSTFATKDVPELGIVLGVGYNKKCKLT